MNVLTNYTKKARKWLLYSAMWLTTATTSPFTQANTAENIKDLAEKKYDYIKARLDNYAPGTAYQLNNRDTNLPHYNFGWNRGGLELYYASNNESNNTYRHYGFFNRFAGLRFTSNKDTTETSIGLNYDQEPYFRVRSTYKTDGNAPISLDFLVDGDRVETGFHRFKRRPFLKGVLRSVDTLRLNDDLNYQARFDYTYRQKFNKHYHLVTGILLRKSFNEKTLDKSFHIGAGRHIKWKEYDANIELTLNTNGNLIFDISRRIDFNFL